MSTGAVYPRPVTENPLGLKTTQLSRPPYLSGLGKTENLPTTGPPGTVESFAVTLLVVQEVPVHEYRTAPCA